MNLYQQLDDSYRHLTRRDRPAWLDAGSLDDLVDTIRDDRPDSTASDLQLHRLVSVARHDRDALTVALYALATKLRCRLGRAITDEFRCDALSDLVLVLLDSPLDGSRLAGRLVNRAHNRTHKNARHVHRRGVVNPVTITATDPQHFTAHPAPDRDIADIAASRVDLERFARGVQAAVAAGDLSERAWLAYREHRLRRAVADSPACGAYQRTTASRTARKLQALTEQTLHAA